MIEDDLIKIVQSIKDDVISILIKAQIFNIDLIIKVCAFCYYIHTFYLSE